MMKKTLSALTGKINIEEIRGPLDRAISGFCVDSRVWQAGEMYVAQPGIHSDGHDYIDDLIKRGCRAILHSLPLSSYADDVTYLRVSDTRKALSPISAEFYDHPSGKLKVIGITGTDGKSSTVSFTHQLLGLLGKKAGFISTVEYQTGETVEKNPYRMSTPESFEVHKLMHDMIASGKEYAVIESTSHGLSSKNARLADVNYLTAVLTNVTHEHLEFHGTIEQYAYDKSNLFRQLHEFQGTPPTAIIRYEEPFSHTFKNAFTGHWLTYSAEHTEADAYAADIQESNEGISFILRYRNECFPCFIPLAGLFNVQNVLAAFLSVVSATGESPKSITTVMPRLHGVTGRMETVSCGQKFKAIVDYAHSPGSFEKILPQIRSTTKGRLILLFGSAGERDTAKRPIQGKIAAAYSDIIVLSDEDPRGEEGMAILTDIAKGCAGKIEGKTLFLIPDRCEGILKALSLAEPYDTVMFLGKGHESTIIYKDHKLPWNEASEVKNALQKLGYTSVQ